MKIEWLENRLRRRPRVRDILHSVGPYRANEADQSTRTEPARTKRARVVVVDRRFALEAQVDSLVVSKKIRN